MTTHHRNKQTMKHVMTTERNETNTINETPALERARTTMLATLFANKSKVVALALLLGCGLLAMAAASGNDNRAPEVPDEISVGETNKVHFHGFGGGVQIYTWNGSTWGAAVPKATLFDDDGNVVADHFAGPTWVSNSGSQVVGALPPLSVTVDTNAIPWLRLTALNPEGPGIFAGTTFIQRVNTTGGKAPSANGTFVGQVARVPYSADYFFYRHT